MTLPGPIIIRECSACGKHISQFTLTSYYIDRTRLWTDTRNDNPDFPKLVKCPHCSALIWIYKQKQVGQYQFLVDRRSEKDKADMEKFIDAESALTPSLQDYATYLETTKLNQKREHYVRLRMWWVGNDPRRIWWADDPRCESDQLIPLDFCEIENLRALVILCDETKLDERIMKAEILRELGEFADAQKFLSDEFDNEYLSRAASFIRGLCQKEITNVAEICDPEEPKPRDPRLIVEDLLRPRTDDSCKTRYLNNRLSIISASGFDNIVTLLGLLLVLIVALAAYTVFK